MLKEKDESSRCENEKNKWLKKKIKKIEKKLKKNFAGTVSTIPVPAINGGYTPYTAYI